VCHRTDHEGADGAICLYTKHKSKFAGDKKMLETIIVLLVILWVLGLVSSTTMGGFIHILIVIAVVVLLVRVIRGRGI